MSIRTSANRIRKGFTLVELAVVIVIIGVLAAFGVPKFLTSVERSKASEAFSYLSAVRDAEERYLAQQGVYATALTQLDISVPAPKYFTTAGAITAAQDATGNPTWSYTLTRDVTSSSYGAYTVTFTSNGFDSTNSTIPTTISPMGTTGTTSS
jgi:prepilin-type N-terminal cleavage/methylation domain-containing protein